MGKKLLVTKLNGCTVFLPEEKAARQVWKAAPSRTDGPSMPVVIPGGLGPCFDPAVDAFDDETSIFVGPKGMGKSTLLTLKRALIEGEVSNTTPVAKDIKCLPDRNFSGTTAFHAPQGELDELRFLTAKEQGQFSVESMWESVWCFLFGAYILQAENDRTSASRLMANRRTNDDDKFLDSDKEKDSLSSEIVPSTVKAIVGLSAESRLESNDFWRYLRRIVKSGTSQKALAEIYEEKIMPALRIAVKANRYCIFLDAIDEQLKDAEGQQLLRLVHKRRIARKAAPAEDIDDPAQKEARNYDIWAGAQLSLIGTADKLLHDTNGKVRLYTSMRSEAFHSYVGGQAIGQLVSCCQIEYDPHRLKTIVAANVLVDMDLHNKANIDFSKNVKNSDQQVEKFFGSDNYVVGNGTHESWIACMLRQTMWRPRELMLIGANISLDKCSTLSELTAEQKLTLIGIPTHQILDDFTKFLGVAWPPYIVEDVLPQIKSNVLTPSDIAEIAESLKTKTNGDIAHPFCRLYSLGLIGVVERTETGQQIQKFDFLAVDKQGALDEGLPGNSPYFLVHPLLQRRIQMIPSASRQVKYHPMPAHVIGHLESWSDPETSVLCEISKTNSVVQITINGIVVVGAGVASALENRLSKARKQDRKAVAAAKRFEKIGNQPTLFFLLILYCLYSNKNKFVSYSQFESSISDLQTAGWIPKVLAREKRQVKGAVVVNHASKNSDVPGNQTAQTESGKPLVSEAMTLVWDGLKDNPHVLREIREHLKKVIGQGMVFKYIHEAESNRETLIGIHSVDIIGTDIKIVGLPKKNEVAPD